jgi:hypothetical protein
MMQGRSALLREWLKLDAWSQIALWPVLHSTELSAYLRSFSKWYFDLIKNAILLAALFYFAERTKSEFLYKIASFSKLIFTLYCITHLFWWEPPLRAKAKTTLQRDLLGYILIPLVGGLIFYALTTTLNVVTRDLMIAQPR